MVDPDIQFSNRSGWSHDPLVAVFSSSLIGITIHVSVPSSGPSCSPSTWRLAAAG